MNRPSLPRIARRAVWMGVLALLCAAIFSEGVHHADEHYQILEFAGWKLGITPADQLPWEFAERMRPALQPAIAVLVHRTLALFGEPDPFVVAMLLRMLAAALTFSAAILLLRGQLRDNPALHEIGWLKLYLFLAFLLWFGVYCGVRFSSEGFSAALFAMGFAVVVHRKPDGRDWPLLFAGLLLGSAVVARFQMALMVAGLLAWCIFITRMRWSAMGLIVVGGLVSVGLGALIDRWFYGEWVFTAWNYIELNVIQGKAAEFGTHPWWHYFAAIFERAVPPFSLLFLAPPLVLFALRRRSALTWAVLPFLLGHMLIGHKEYRFMFPAVPLLPALVVGGLHAMEERGWFGWLKVGAKHVLRTALLVVHVPLLLVVLFKPAQDDIGFYKELYRITQHGDMILHDNHDPYWQGNPIWYTRRNGVGIAPINSLTEWPSSGRVIYVACVAEPNMPDPPRATLLYSSIPEWLLRINIGGWADRTAVWRIWELQRPADWRPVEH
ncbi:MAG: hypothetical protein WAT74_12380 [Flavobacteriales bacterium]